jgi:4-hydroxymandelate oxidase
MYRSVPPALGAGTAPLRISGAARRAFDGQADSARHPAYRTYLTDMVRPYGLAVDTEALDEGRGQSYGDMAGALIAEVAAGDQPADLLVMAFAVPDVTPWRCTAAHLSQLCPGGPMAFAVSDCGTTAAFTGLRLIRAQAAITRGGAPSYPPQEGTSSPRALLIVVEQAAINHELPAGASAPVRHAAVALRCDQAGLALVDAVRLRSGAAGPEAADLLATGLAELSAGRDDLTVIAGAELAQAAGAAALPPGAEVVLAPAGQPCTGVWWEVAGRLDQWAARGRRVLVADYDPLPGSFCLAVIDVAGPSPASP